MATPSPRCPLWPRAASVAACVAVWACGDGGGDITDLPAQDPPPAPASPQGIPDGGIVQGSITFAWTPSPGAVRYHVQLDHDASFTDPIQAEVTPPQWTPSFEIEAGDYLWRVRAGAETAWGNWSTAWPVTILAAAPGAPSLVAPGDGSHTSDDRPRFRWTAAVGATRHEFQLDNDDDFASPDVLVEVDDTTFTPAGALTPRTYWWRVRSRNGAGPWGDWSSVRSVVVVDELRTLTLAKSGSGTVSSSPPGLMVGIGGTSAVAEFPAGEQVTLAAAPVGDWRVGGWGGACVDAGTAPHCVVDLTVDRTVSVSFVPITHPLSVSVEGEGGVTSLPTGLDVEGPQGSGAADFHQGVTVRLSAVPAPGWATEGWEGACEGRDTATTCDVEITGPRTAGVSFAPLQYPVVASVRGSGALTSAPEGLEVSGDGDVDSALFDFGSEVTLTAAPAAGWRVIAWSGACDGAGTATACTFTVAGDTGVSVTFARTTVPVRTLDVTATGSGSVTSTPGGIAVDTLMPVDTAVFADGTAVDLTATAAQGWAFAGWGGACSGTGSCTVTMDRDRSVTATFTAVVTPTWALDVTATGAGSVTSTPAGIVVDTLTPADTATFADGTAVALSATAAQGWTFTGWGGACSNASSCTVTMDQDRSVTAAFAPVRREVLVVARFGQGFVDSSPAGIRLDTTMVADSASFVYDTTVQLRARGAPGWSFAGWGGACGGKGTCSVKMTGLRFVSATFVQSSGGVPEPGSTPPAPSPSAEGDPAAGRPVFEHRERPDR